MRERGNILFLILLAVVLFAALSYAVTQSTRGEGKNASGEKAELFASQIMQHGQAIETAITRMRVTGGCKDTEISFENAAVSGYTNVSTPVDGHCKVFDPAGGGQGWRYPPEGANETAGALYQYLALPVAGVGAWQETTPSRCVLQTTDIQATCRDLVIMLGHVQPAVCTIINQKNGITWFSENWSGAMLNSGSKFTGSYAGGSDDIWQAGTQPFGKLEGCFNQTTSGDVGKWYYYRVLIAR